jgi:UDP-N-acetylmuramoyl-tripeptide--D-alanyl-D-alanine ligase
VLSWELDAVVRASGAEVVRRGTATRFTTVATDSRALAGGELFVALRGPRYDAHHFLAEAVAAGATGVVVERGVDLDDQWDGVVILRVPDTLRALQDLAAARRRALAPCVLGITGSNGKTTTKEMLAAILIAAEGAERVLKTSVNLNNLIGVPLTLLGLTGRERHAVVEMGMNAPGEIWRLAEIADPDVGVITNVGPAHLEGVGSLDGVAQAKGELFARMRASAVAVANADDPRVAALAETFAGRVVRFGAGAEVAATAVRCAPDASTFHLRVNGTSAEVRLRIPGRHNVANALAAAAAAHAVGIGIDAIAAGLGAATAVGNRMRLLTLAGGVTILNDSYNANPASVAAALHSLAEAPARRRVAVLGDMLELGPDSAAHHRAIGRLAADLGVDALYLYGDHAAETARGATDAPRAAAEGAAGGAPTLRAAGVAPAECLPEAAVHVATTHDAIAAALVAELRAGDWVLVKGSRGQRMEEVVRLLGAPA